MSKAASQTPIDPFSPLTILPGPNKRDGVPIYSHALPVLFRTNSYPRDTEPIYTGQSSTAYMSFCKPMVGLDNRIGFGDRFADQPQVDDDARPFKERFPCQMSADGRRARIGVLMRNGYYDVEVDLFNGVWTPVECAYDGYSGSYSTWFAAAPVRETQ